MEQRENQGTDLQPDQSPRPTHQAVRTGCCALRYLQRELCPAQALALVEQAEYSTGDPAEGLQLPNAEVDINRALTHWWCWAGGWQSTWGTTATAPLSEPCCRSRTSIPSSRTAPPCTVHEHEHPLSLSRWAPVQYTPDAGCKLWASLGRPAPGGAPGHRTGGPAAGEA